MAHDEDEPTSDLTSEAEKPLESLVVTTADAHQDTLGAVSVRPPGDWTFVSAGPTADLTIRGSGTSQLFGVADNSLISSASFSASSYIKASEPDEVLLLRQDLESIRGSLRSIKRDMVATREGTTTNQELSQRLDQIEESASKALDRSDSLSATVETPSPEEMVVRLVPAHRLGQLEEYRTDQSIFFGIVGLFGGAALGIVSNWATNEQYRMPRASIVLIALLLILTTFSVVWTVVLGMRAKLAKDVMFGSNPLPVPRQPRPELNEEATKN